MKKKNVLLLSVFIALVLLTGGVGVIIGSIFYDKMPFYTEKDVAQEMSISSDKIAVVNLDVGITRNGNNVKYFEKIVKFPSDNFEYTSLDNARTGLMNGDFVVVEELMGDVRMMANIRFRKVKVRELYSGRTCITLLMDDLLYQPRPNLDERQQTNLFLNFIGRMKRLGITQKKKKEFNDAMLTDPYLNALRCVYGYAVTCHKAQGGEWDEVYIDFPRNITRNPTKGKWQWVYTAMTRAKERVHAKDDFYFN